MHENPAPVTRPSPGVVRIVVAVLVVVALGLLARWVSVERSVAWLSDGPDSLGIWGPLAFAGLFIVATVCLLPSTPITLAAGAILGPVVGAVAIWLAALVSATISFILSRYVAHDRVAGLIRPHSWLEALWRLLGEEEGWKIVAAVRVAHILPFGLQNLLFGVSSIRFCPFLVATAVSMLPGTILYAYLGYLGAEALGAEPGQPLGVLGWAVRLGGLLVIALAVLFIARFARRVIRTRTARTEEEVAEAADVKATR